MTRCICYLFTLNLIFISLLLAQTKSKNPPVVVNAPAPSFFLKTLGGVDYFLSDYCGKPRQPLKQPERKIVVLSFFATYCLPCLKEIPSLQELAKNWQEHAVFVLVDLKEEPDKVRGFVEKYQIQLTVLMDRYGIVAEKYGVESLPCLFLVDESGIIRFTQKGYDEKLIEQLQRPLQSLTNSK